MHDLGVDRAETGPAMEGDEARARLVERVRARKARDRTALTIEEILRFVSADRR